MICSSMELDYLTLSPIGFMRLRNGLLCIALTYFGHLSYPYCPNNNFRFLLNSIEYMSIELIHDHPATSSADSSFNLLEIEKYTF